MRLERSRLFFALLLASCQSGPSTQEVPSAEIALIAITDFHGWLNADISREQGGYRGGLANLAGQLRTIEGLDEQNSILLDNGDMFTGPAESTLLEGAPVIEAYNAMGFDAVNLGNHEFDFGIDVLRKRVEEAEFPFLAANLTEASSGRRPSYLRPWVILDRAGVRVGIIGLSNQRTPQTTLGRFVEGLRFHPYGPTLATEVPKMRAAGAEVIVALIHDGAKLIERQVGELEALGVDLVFAGHHHERELVRVGRVPIINPGPYGRSYARVRLTVHLRTKEILLIETAHIDVGGDRERPEAAPDVATIVSIATHRAHSMSGEIIGQLAEPLSEGESFGHSPLGQLVTDAWLAALPEAEIAMCNWGSFRQPLGRGPVTLGDVLAVLPFRNNLYIVELSGAELEQQLAIDRPVVSGLTWRYREAGAIRQVLEARDTTGQLIDANRRYRVVINDFMYGGGDGYSFAAFDQHPIDTGLSIREPVVRWFRNTKDQGISVPDVSGARGILVTP